MKEESKAIWEVGMERERRKGRKGGSVKRKEGRKEKLPSYHINQEYKNDINFSLQPYTGPQLLRILTLVFKH